MRHDGVEVISGRNVNSILPVGIALLDQMGIERMSRAGPVLEAPWPVVTTYRCPQERVLFSPLRDCNPFFHLFEALWMIAGRNDVEFLTKLNKRMAEYSDDGVVQHGAYGFRWREWFAFDQLHEVIALLKRDPSTRRAVVAMWSPNGDTVASEGAGGLVGTKDVPCNTHIYFKIRDGRLQMTVSNRSNDMLWGAYGANVVHMSFLQEYVANKVRVEVGTYVQMSDSFHVYTSGPGGDVWNKVKPLGDAPVSPDPYTKDDVRPMSLGAEGDDWDEDLEVFFGLFDAGKNPADIHYRTEWFDWVVRPMWTAYTTREATVTEFIKATDWRMAAREWLERRAK